jgi:hypothetical protein
MNIYDFFGRAIALACFSWYSSVPSISRHLPSTRAASPIARLHLMLYLCCYGSESNEMALIVMDR